MFCAFHGINPLAFHIAKLQHNSFTVSEIHAHSQQSSHQWKTRSNHIPNSPAGHCRLNVIAFTIGLSCCRIQYYLRSFQHYNCEGDDAQACSGCSEKAVALGFHSQPPEASRREQYQWRTKLVATTMHVDPPLCSQGGGFSNVNKGSANTSK